MRLSPQTPADRLREARRALLESGEVQHGLLDEPLARSWQRCRESGLQPLQRPPESAFFEGEPLRQALAEQREFLAQARPVMGFLFDQMRDSGSVVVLSDARGLLLHTVGDADFVSRAERVALMPGALWGEADRGTNAIGTALADRLPTVIHGAEHFLERNGFLTCAAAPVADSSGRLLGAVDISGDHRGRHPHTFALVRSAARMIEHRVFSARHAQHVRLHLHPQAEGLGAVGEALVAVADDGWIVGANSLAMEWLGLQAADIGARTVDEVFGRRLGALVEAGQRNDGSAARLSLPRALQGAAAASGGGPLYFRAEREQPQGWAHDQAQGRQPDANAAPRRSSALRRALAGAAGGTAGPVVAGAAPAVGGATAATDARLPLDATIVVARMRARRALAHALPLLLQGESGSGKDLFAQELHGSGPRRVRPYVAVNCAALPETLIESELFGYVGGAFTGARREGSSGRIREADGGTLFLDEIGDMPLPMQARLLRVLQERSVTPLGGGKPQPVDFLLICATHRNLREEVAAGRFREDLYYRINGLTLLLPPLRDRQDFAQIVRDKLTALCPDQDITLAEDVAAALKLYRWPGNLRQLHNVLSAACAMLDPGEACIDWPHLPDDLRAELSEPRVDALHVAEPGPLAAGVQDTNLRRLSNRAIAQVVEACGGNLSEAARRLGISRNTLYRRLRQGEG